MNILGRNLALLLGTLVVNACAEKAPLYQEKLVYNAIGASDSLGVGAFPLSDGYTFRIQDELKDQGRNVALFHIGIPGANTDIIANAAKTAAERGVSAELATIWVGANDLVSGVPVETFALDLHNLLSAVQEDMQAYVILANIPPLPEFPSFIEDPSPEVTEDRVAQYNTVIKNQALARGIPIVDLSNDTIDGHLVNDFDGLHPDDDGHERLAQLFMKMIRPVL